MSTILKALQRLEDEKSANVEHSLDEQIVAQRPPPAPDRRGLRIGAIAIGGLAVAVAAFFFWFTRKDPVAEVAMELPPPAVAPVVAAVQEVAAEKPRRKPLARPAPAARAQQDLPEVEVASIIEVVKRLDAQPADTGESAASSKHAAPTAKADAAQPAQRPSARKPDTQVAHEPAQPRPAQKQIANAKLPAIQISENSVPEKPVPAPPAPAKTVAVVEKPVPAPPAPAKTVAVVEKPVPAPPAPAKTVAVVEKPVPAPLAPVEIVAVAEKPAPTAAPTLIQASIQELEKKVVQRAKLPALSVEKTIWHPDADRRVAIVKLIGAEGALRLKEGDAVGPLVVEVIKPGSVLFNHDGIEIQYNVGG